MREIKFRGRCLDGWIYSECIWFNEFPTFNDRQIYMPNTNNENCDELNIETWDMVFDIGQYIGLKDKNGKEIYEGDIVNYFRNELAEVKFINGCFAIESKHYIDYFNEIVAEIEVVGNIYENKELLA